MENTQPVLARNYVLGLCVIACSFIAYLSAPLLKLDSSDDFGPFGLFLFHYLAAIFYLILIWRKQLWDNMIVLLVLLHVSAWSLNRSIPVFEDSVMWLNVFLVVSGLNYLLLRYMERVPVVVRHLICILLGISLMLFLYLAVYIGPFYTFSVIGLLGLGISVHSFVPVFFVIYTIRKTITLTKENRWYGWSIGTGAFCAVLVAVIFIVQWGRVNTIVSKNFRSNLIADNTSLPGWIKVAQHLPENAITEKYLKADLVYTMPSNYWGSAWSMPSMNFEEVRKHDPLVMLAGVFTKMPDISREERIKTLEAMYNSGHQTQERLWSGANLETSNVTTNIRLWPEQRFAYTEKTVMVQNTGNIHRWWNREEAIYTFHLPEGGVVTSLSLWIDGKERKGIPTSKHKADSAYKQIVGVENRDPSIVHWQEGNTVSVRVFPVESRKNRIFKIGVTAPLSFDSGKLAYENIWFEGPSFTGADETRQVDWVSEPGGITMPGFTKNGTHRYIKEGKYDQHWSLEFAAPQFRSQDFGFDGKRYSVNIYERQRGAAVFKNVYLDVNSEWSREELDKVYDMVKDKAVFVLNENLIQVSTAELKGDIGNTLLRQRFSLFPFSRVADPASSLVITKSSLYSPSLNDLKGSEFGDSLIGVKYMAPIKLFNIGTELSPYLRTLKEHRIFEYEQGNSDLLKQLVSSNTFVHSIENDDTVTVDNAMISFTRTPDTNRKSGADHIMRLFAYNHLMSRLKGNLFPANDPDSSLVSEAEQAYIVTPVSSLIVLETQEDYEKFKIIKGKNTLDDATLRSKGAVPEPHEWALILLAVALLGWVMYRERLKKLINWF